MKHAFDRLESLLPALRALTAGWSVEDWRWKPAPERWSALDVLGHLLLEEREDFSVRLASTLADSATEWPPIDPEGAVARGDFAGRDPAALLDELAAERAAKLVWLRDLDEPDWRSEHRKGSLSMRAGDLLAAWTRHDLLHLRQVLELRMAREAAEDSPFDPGYAGG